MLFSRLFAHWRTIRFCLSALAVAAFLGWTLSHPTAQVSPDSGRLPAHVATQSGSGGAGAGGSRLGATMPDLCNPFDPGCFLDGAASSMAQSVLNAFTPVIDNFLRSSVNIISQTPPVDSYQNPTVDAFNALFTGVIDAALACLLVIGGYTILVGSHLSMPQSSLGELLPRVVLVVMAVHFNLVFLGSIIDMENTVNLAIIHTSNSHILTNTIASLLSLNPTVGLLLVMLAIVLGIMTVLLVVQMIARLALVDLLLALAPLGLGCLILPQTVRWGRLWLTSFSAAVWVQMIQLVALALGSVFLTAISAPETIFHGNVLATALLAVGTLGLVLKIPGMLHQWALSPLWQGGQSHSDSRESEWDGAGGSTTSGDGGGDVGSGIDGGWGGNVVEGTIVTESEAASGSTVLLLA